MPALQNELKDANIDPRTKEGFDDLNALQNVIRVVTILGGESRYIDQISTVGNYIGSSPILKNLPKYVSVWLKSQM